MATIGLSAAEVDALLAAGRPWWPPGFATTRSSPSSPTWVCG
jgi:hypothetical protein